MKVSIRTDINITKAYVRKRKNERALTRVVVHALTNAVSETINQILVSAREVSCVASGSRREISKTS
jgi:hypothetical protein